VFIDAIRAQGNVGRHWDRKLSKKLTRSDYARLRIEVEERHTEGQSIIGIQKALGVSATFIKAAIARRGDSV